MIFSVPRPHVIQPVSTFAWPFLITHGNANSVVVVVVDCTAPVQHALRSTRFSHNSAAWAS